MNLESHPKSPNKRTPARKILFGLSIFGSILVFAIMGLAIYVARTWDKVWEAPLPEVRVSKDPKVIKRGEYLVYGPAHCIECHSTENSLGQLADGVKLPLSGGLRIGLEPLGTIYAPNLTPDRETGIGRYSDAQIARMMRWAVCPRRSRDGGADHAFWQYER